MATSSPVSQIIHVINASSRTDTGITEELARSLSEFQASSLPEFQCVTLIDGPNGITTARDSAEAALAVLRYIEQHQASPSCAGFIVACFSDPGVFESTDVTAKPVVGIGGAGLGAAIALGPNVGTIGVSISGGKKVRQLARQYGVEQCLTGHRDLGLDYADLQNPDLVGDALIAAGRSLRDSDGAQVLLLAGAGMARYVGWLNQTVELPVIDPTRAAAGVLLAQVLASPLARPE